jgi:hypothetical protein
MGASDGAYLAGEPPASCVLVEMEPQLSFRESGVDFFAHDFDFPPTKHPVRELITFILLVLLITALEIWGGWKLISLILTWLD